MQLFNRVTIGMKFDLGNTIVSKLELEQAHILGARVEFGLWGRACEYVNFGFRFT